MTTSADVTGATVDPTGTATGNAFETGLRGRVDRAEDRADQSFIDFHEADADPFSTTHRHLYRQSLIACGRYLGVVEALMVLLEGKGDDHAADALLRRSGEAVLRWFPHG